MDAAFPEEVGHILADEDDIDESSNESEGDEFSDSDEDFLWNAGTILFVILASFEKALENMM